MRRTSLLLLSLLTAGPLAAQVGHDPQSSPYRELSYPTGVSALAGYFGGGGGSLGVGPHDGWMYGGRVQVRGNRALSIGLGVMYGTLQRRVLDPSAPVTERDKGLADQSLLIPEAVITMNLTGGKSWHRLAPYLGFGIGAAFGGDVASDSSGYQFGTKFSFAPFAGMRVVPSPRLALRAEIRGNLWKLSYPISYRTANSEGDILIADGTVGEWIMSEFFIFGASFYF